MLAVFAGIPSPLRAGLPVPASVVIIPPLSERLGLDLAKPERQDSKLVRERSPRRHDRCQWHCGTRIGAGHEMESSNVRFPCSPGNRRPSLRVGIVPTSKNYRCALRRLKEDSWLSPSNAKGTFSHPCLRVGQKQAGAAGGICSRSAETQPSSYRYHVTMAPRNARAAGAPCTILHDGVTWRSRPRGRMVMGEALREQRRGRGR